MATWRDRDATASAPTQSARRAAWQAGCIRPEDRDGYWLTTWYQTRLAGELEACRTLEDLQAVEARIQRRYAPTAQWRAVNDAMLEPLREVAKTLRHAVREAERRSQPSLSEFALGETNNLMET